jgi:hypothetical protein
MLCIVLEVDEIQNDWRQLMLCIMLEVDEIQPLPILRHKIYSPKE